MFERIVVGVSKVESAKEAARRAKDLATRFGAELHLVTAVEGPDGDPTSPQARQAEGLLESIVIAAAIPMTKHVLSGDPADAIVRVATDVRADLIVVGNKGMQRRILGSIPNTVAHRAPCSVLILATT